MLSQTPPDAPKPSDTVGRPVDAVIERASRETFGLKEQPAPALRETRPDLDASRRPRSRAAKRLGASQKRVVALRLAKERPLPLGFDLGEYYALNDAIFEHFFRPEYSGRAVTLALDDAEAAVIERDIGLEEGQLAERLFAAIRTLATPISGSKDRFIWWAEREVRECVALLAASVLIMSRQGLTEGGQIDQYGYYTKYNSQVLQQRSSAAPSGFDLQKRLWRRLEAYLNVELDGALGRIVFLRVLEYTHLNFPASQCLIRALDRRRLHELFRRYCDPKTQLSRERFGAIIAQTDAGLSRGFLRVARQVATQNDLAEEFWTIIVDEYTAWQHDPLDSIVRISGSSAVHKAVTGPALASKTFDRGLVQSASTRGEVPEQRVPKPVTRIESRSRLVLTGYPGPCVQLSLEGLIRGGESAALCDWSSIGGYLTGEEFREGFRRESKGFVFRVGPHDRAYFGREGTQWVELFRLPSQVGDMCVLCVEELADDLGTDLETHGYDVKTLTLTKMLSGLRGYVFTFAPVAKTHASPDMAGTLLVGETSRLELVSGLRLKDGRFVRGGAPRVLLRDPNSIQTDVLLDGVVIGCAIVGTPFALPSDLTDGEHVVEALSLRRRFVVAPSDDDGKPQDAPSLGFVISRHPAAMRTDASAEDLKIDELARNNAAVLVGCDLLLPYRRMRS
jgi:hypothetical protein